MTDPLPQPTLGEVVRRLDEAVRELRDMRRDIAEDRSRMEQRFLPRAEHELTRRTDEVQMKGMEDELHSLSKRLVSHEESAEKREDSIIELIRGHETMHKGRTWQLTVLIVGILLTTAANIVGGFLLAGH